MTDHKELRRLAAAATPGPWNGVVGDSVVHVVEGNGMPIFDTSTKRYYERHDQQDCANVDFVCGANPKAVTALLDELESAQYLAERSSQGFLAAEDLAEKAEAEREQLRGQLAKVHAWAAAPRSAEADGRFFTWLEALATPLPAAAMAERTPENAAWHANEEELRKRIEESRPEMQALIEEDLKPGGLFDRVFAKKPTPAEFVQVRTPGTHEVCDECERSIWKGGDPAENVHCARGNCPIPIRPKQGV